MAPITVIQKWSKWTLDKPALFKLFYKIQPCSCLFDDMVNVDGPGKGRSMCIPSNLYEVTLSVVCDGIIRKGKSVIAKQPCQAPSYYWRWGGLFEGDLPGPISDCCTRQQYTCVPVCVCLACVVGKAGRSFNIWTTKVLLPGLLDSVCLCLFIALFRYAGLCLVSHVRESI